MLARALPHRLQKGDTIVEVMISLAILGLAIGMSYGAANRSLQNLRQAQENAAASGLLRSQAESLRYLAANGDDPSDPNDVFKHGRGLFCITSTFTISTNLSTTGPCYKNNLYTVTINRDDPTLTNDTFLLKASWPDVRGGVNDSVTMVYRIHPS